MAFLQLVDVEIKTYKINQTVSNWEFPNTILTYAIFDADLLINLTHRNIYLGQDWLRCLLGAGWQQAIAWTNTDFSFVRLCGIHLRATRNDCPGNYFVWEVWNLYIKITGTSFIGHWVDILIKGRMTHTCVNKIIIIGLNNGWSAPSHYLNKYWKIINWALGNKRQWNFNQENASQYGLCKMASMVEVLPVMEETSLCGIDMITNIDISTFHFYDRNECATPPSSDHFHWLDTQNSCTVFRCCFFFVLEWSLLYLFIIWYKPRHVYPFTIFSDFSFCPFYHVVTKCRCTWYSVYKPTFYKSPWDLYILVFPVPTECDHSIWL